MVFSEGSKWGEELFKAVFNEDIKETDIYEDVDIDKPFNVYDVELEDQLYEAGIIVYENKKSSLNLEDNSIDNIEIPIVLKIFQTKISLQELDKLGETSEIILDEGSIFPVELLINGKVIGYGELLVNNDEYKLKIKTLNI